MNKRRFAEVAEAELARQLIKTVQDFSVSSWEMCIMSGWPQTTRIIVDGVVIHENRLTEPEDLPRVRGIIS